MLSFCFYIYLFCNELYKFLIIVNTIKIICILKFICSKVSPRVDPRECCYPRLKIRYPFLAIVI